MFLANLDCTSLTIVKVALVISAVPVPLPTFANIQLAFARIAKKEGEVASLARPRRHKVLILALNLCQQRI
jgi:hypothetical protein